jgi:hypothetical protein
MHGRIRAHEAVSQGKMTFEGDAELVAAFNQRFQGINAFPGFINNRLQR